MRRVTLREQFRDTEDANAMGFFRRLRTFIGLKLWFLSLLRARLLFKFPFGYLDRFNLGRDYTSYCTLLDQICFITCFVLMYHFLLGESVLPSYLQTQDTEHYNVIFNVQTVLNCYLPTFFFL